MTWFFISIKRPGAKRALLLAREGLTRLRARALQWDENHIDKVMEQLRRNNPNYTVTKKEAYP